MISKEDLSKIEVGTKLLVWYCTSDHIAVVTAIDDTWITTEGCKGIKTYYRDNGEREEKCYGFIHRIATEEDTAFYKVPRINMDSNNPLYKK